MVRLGVCVGREGEQWLSEVRSKRAQVQGGMSKAGPLQGIPRLSSTYAVLLPIIGRFHIIPPETLFVLPDDSLKHFLHFAIVPHPSHSNPELRLCPRTLITYALLHSAGARTRSRQVPASAFLSGLFSSASGLQSTAGDVSAGAAAVSDTLRVLVPSFPVPNLLWFTRLTMPLPENLALEAWAMYMVPSRRSLSTFRSVHISRLEEAHEPCVYTQRNQRGKEERDNTRSISAAQPEP